MKTRTWGILENNPGKLMRYDDAIDLAVYLSKEEGDRWIYRAEINATSGMARVSVFDDKQNKLGYL